MSKDVTRTQALRLRKVSLARIAWEFFQIGITGFGGGLQGRFYHLAVKKYDWLDDDEFAEVNATASLAPGGNASNVGIEIARRLRGLGGMVVAALAMLLPGAVIMIMAGKFYREHQNVPALKGALEGLEAAATALILYSATKLGLASWRPPDYVLAIVTAVLMIWLRAPLWLVIPGLGGLSYYLRRKRTP